MKYKVGDIVKGKNFEGIQEEWNGTLGKVIVIDSKILVITIEFCRGNCGFEGNFPYRHNGRCWNFTINNIDNFLILMTAKKLLNLLDME